MTTGSTPRVPWDDDRLAAALAARAAANPTPSGLAAQTLASVRVDRRGVTTGWRRFAPAMATAAVVVVTAIASMTLIGARRTEAPVASPPLGSPTPMDPRDRAEVLGLPVRTVIEAMAIRDAGIDDREIAVRGWFSPILPMSCPATLTVSPVQPSCPDQFVVLMSEPESLVTVREDGSSGDGPTGPSIQIDLDDLDGAWRPGLPDIGAAIPIEITVIGHFDDRRASLCPNTEEQACRDRLIIDRVDQARGVAQPLSVLDDVAGQARSPGDEIVAIAQRQAPDGSILSAFAIDSPEDLVRVEPLVATSELGLLDQDVVWVVQVLEGEWSTTYLIPDGTEDVYQMDPERVIRIAPFPTPPAEETVLGLPVISVPELIARRAADPTPEEIAVQGWILTSDVVYDCAIDLDPHPLEPWCQIPVFLMERPEAVTGLSPDGPYVLPLLGPDMHYQGDAPRNVPVEVIAIGHLDDHRSSTCPTNGRPSCRRHFVVDRIVPAEGPFDVMPEPWRLGGSAQSEPVGEPSDVIGRLEGLVGDLTVVSIGFVDGEVLGTVEPIVRKSDDIDALIQRHPVWVVRALVTDDADPATARTFTVRDVKPGEPGATIWELDEGGVTPLAEPESPWPPAGATVIELRSFVGRDRPPARVAVVDGSGQQLTAVREAGDTDPAVTLQGSDRAALIRDSDGALRLVWIGGSCDGDMTVTIDAGVRRILVDGGRRPACDAMAIGRDLVLDFAGPIKPAGVEVFFTETLIPD